MYRWGFSAPRANFDSINLLLTPAMAIALLCVLEGNSMKSLAARDGDRLDSNQKCSVPGWPISLAGSSQVWRPLVPLTRSQLNSSSGAKTPVSSLLSGLIVLAGVFALAPLIGYIPNGFARCCRCRNRNFAAERPSAPNGNQNDQIR